MWRILGNSEHEKSRGCYTPALPLLFPMCAICPPRHGVEKLAKFVDEMILAHMSFGIAMIVAK